MTALTLVRQAAPPTGGAVRPDSVLRLHPLTLTPEAGRFLVGRPGTGRTVALPPVGIELLGLLGSGQTVAEASRALSARGAVAVDVPAVARALVALGFVAAVDDVPTPEPVSPRPGRLAGLAGRVRRRARPRVSALRSAPPAARTI